MAKSYRNVFESLMNFFQNNEFDQMYALCDPNVHWQIKGVPALEGTYNLQKIKDLNNRIFEATQGKRNVTLHELLTEDKKAVVHFVQVFTQNEGKRIPLDTIWLIELNKEGTKVARIESFILSNPDVNAFGELIKKAA